MRATAMGAQIHVVARAVEAAQVTPWRIEHDGTHVRLEVPYTAVPRLQGPLALKPAARFGHYIERLGTTGGVTVMVTARRPRRVCCTAGEVVEVWGEDVHAEARAKARAS